MVLKYKIAYNTLIQFIGRFFTSILGFATTVILARFLGVEQYGVYAKIYTLISFFYLFIDFGLNAVFIRKYKGKIKKISSVFICRTFIFLISFFLITMFLIITQNNVYSFTEKLWVILFIPTILFFGYFTTLNIIFQLKLRYDLSVLANLLGSTFGLILLIIVLPLGLSWVIISLVSGYLLTLILAYILARRLINFEFLVKDRPALNLLKEAVPIGTMLFLNTIYARADILILSAIKGNSAVGVYQLAYKFFEFPLSFAAFFANAIFPYYVKTYVNNKKKFWNIFKKATLGLFLSSFVFSLVGLIIAPWLRLISPDYVLSTQPLQILVLSYPVFFLTSALSWLLFIKKQEKHLIWIYGLGFIINIIANLYFIPQYSYLAASWITVIGEVIILFLLILKLVF